MLVAPKTKLIVYVTTGSIVGSAGPAIQDKVEITQTRIGDVTEGLRSL